MKIRDHLANTAARLAALTCQRVKSGLGTEIICCPSAIAIAAREHHSPSLQLGRRIPVLPRSTLAKRLPIKQPTRQAAPRR
jgi:hypothetical protein